LGRKRKGPRGNVASSVQNNSPCRVASTWRRHSGFVAFSSSHATICATDRRRWPRRRRRDGNAICSRIGDGKRRAFWSNALVFKAGDHALVHVAAIVVEQFRAKRAMLGDERGQFGHPFKAGIFAKAPATALALSIDVPRPALGADQITLQS
jgi:hypothetical protein